MEALIVVLYGNAGSGVGCQALPPLLGGKRGTRTGGRTGALSTRR